MITWKDHSWHLYLKSISYLYYKILNYSLPSFDSVFVNLSSVVDAITMFER